MEKINTWTFFSTRYKDLTLFLKESKSIFQNVDLALENKIFII